MIGFKDFIADKDISKEEISSKNQIENNNQSQKEILQEKKKFEIQDVIDFIKKIGIKFKNIEFIKNGAQIIFFKEDSAENVFEELKIPEILNNFDISKVGKIISIIEKSKK